MKTDKILIVADDSISSQKAICYGFKIAAGLGARVMLLSVIEPEDIAGNPDAGIFPDDIRRAAKKRIEAFLSEMKQKYGSGTDTEIASLVGEIQKVVVEAAKEWGAGLIVAGTHGRTGINKLFHGSIAESIIHGSPIPVCVVPLHE